VEVVVFLALMWILPIYIAHRIGSRKGRVGWAWGLVFGWLGVLIVALLSNRQAAYGTR
jgi:hypothetical protein